jgi:CheY-like chemotaxis protein
VSGRVLVVDDDAEMREMLRGDLGERGFTVTTCAVATEALDHLEAAEVDAIVTDLNMPGMSASPPTARTCR